MKERHPQSQTSLRQVGVMILSGFLSGTSIAATDQKTAYESKPIAAATLKELLSKSQKAAKEFPLEAHPLVIDRLNEWLSDETRQQDIKTRLERMERFSPLITKHLEARGLPTELLAIPFVETGFENHPGNRNGTGLWMFTRITAREYGLEVNKTNDERRDPAKATIAATKVLDDYHDQLGDWLLAIAAYNQGPGRVRRAIRKGGTRNVWTLIEQGHLNRYVEKVVAAAALIKFPSLREDI